MRSLLCLSVLAIVLAVAAAIPLDEVPENNEQQAATLYDVDQLQQGFENVGERQARQFGYGGFGGYRGGYGGGYGGFGGYRGGYGGFGRYRGGYGGYRGGYGGYRGGFYG